MSYAISKCVDPTSLQELLTNDRSADAGKTVSLPQGGGSVQGFGETFQPNIFTGTGDFAIPIATSPGRAGFGPQLSLQYSTGNGNGPFGLGWQLSIPRITRKTEKGLPRYDDRDHFVMSGAENLVVQLESSANGVDQPDWQPVRFQRAGYEITLFRPRTEGLFARIERWQKDDEVHWRATTKDNVTSVYGKSSAARIANPANDSQVFQWLLEETHDPKGNRILYEYVQENDARPPDALHEQNRSPRQTYIRRIRYGNQPTSPNEPESRFSFEVIFDYETVEPVDGQFVDRDIDQWSVRPDPFSSFRSGFEIRTLRRCERVLMLHHFDELQNQRPLVKSTTFNYEANVDNQVSMLAGVTVTGYRYDEASSRRSSFAK